MDRKAKTKPSLYYPTSENVIKLDRVSHLGSRVSALTVRIISCQFNPIITFSFIVHSLQSQVKKQESLNLSFLSSVGYNRSIQLVKTQAVKTQQSMKSSTNACIYRYQFCGNDIQYDNYTPTPFVNPCSPINCLFPHIPNLSEASGVVICEHKLTKKCFLSYSVWNFPHISPWLTSRRGRFRCG